jgi:hypothetical protein
LQPSPAAFRLRGLALAVRGEKDKAIADLKKAIDLYSGQGNTAQVQKLQAELKKIAAVMG